VCRRTLRLSLLDPLVVATFHIRVVRQLFCMCIDVGRDCDMFLRLNRGIFQPNISAVDLNANASSRIGSTDLLVLRHRLSESLLGQFLDVPTLAELLRDRSAEGATSLVNNLLLRGVHQLNVIHDRVPERELHLGDELEHAVHLILADPALKVR